MSDLSDVSSILPVALYKKLQKQLEPIVEKVEALEYATQTIEATPGPKGERGDKGLSGEQGPRGERGETGPQGIQGPRGETGPQGEQGIQGPRGETGPQGEQGIQGPQGERGETGPQGEKGEVGPQGEQGIQGERGPQGERGETGPQGEVGPQGEQGIQGERGERGETGPQGEKGEKGETGPQGERGERGEAGPQGEVGPQGIQGERGEIGPKGEKGDRGERGERGETGPQGERGERGEAGPRGEVGPQGPEGPPGKDATIPDINSIVEPFISNAQTNIDSYIDKSEKTFKNWQSMVNTQLSTIGGGGEVWLGRLNDVDRASAKVDGAYLKYDAATKKWVGSNGSVNITTNTDTNLVGFISGNGSKISGATVGTFNPDSSTIAIRDSGGRLHATQLRLHGENFYSQLNFAPNPSQNISFNFPNTGGTIATTSFVTDQASTTNPLMNGTVAVGTSLRYARADHVHPIDTSRAPLSSPSFTGTPTAPNPASDSNNTRIATTSFVTGKVSTLAPLDSPSFTGTPTAPTPLSTSNDTSIATTNFVTSKLGGFVDLTSNQTIAGTKTFTGQVVLNFSNNQLVLKNGSAVNSMLITVPTNLTANRTITIPDVGASGAFVLNVGPQNISGVKTFTTSPIVPTPTTSEQAATKGYVDSFVRILNTQGRISNSTTTETDIHSYILPIGTLANNGESVEIELFGFTANNVNNKQFRFYFGGSEYIDFGSITLQNTSWTLRIKIQRGEVAGGTGYMKILGILDYDTGKIIKTVETPNTAIDSTTTIVTRITATGVANNDIVSLAGKTVWTRSATTY